MKLSKETRAHIHRRFHELGDDNISELAREYKVSRQYIQQIVYPERLARIRAQQKARRDATKT